jgi:putative thioredoxin
MATADNPLVFETGDPDFEAAVLERSEQTPVVVDFWAEWCGPCKALGPVLEALAEEYGGQFVLAKVDVDRNPGLSSAFGVRSIPMVVGFRHGRPVASFLGAQPEAAIRDFLAQVLPSAAETMVAEAARLRAAGDTVAATAKLHDALESDARCDPALLLLAELAIERNATEEALELLERITPGTPERQHADRLSAQIRVGEAAGTDLGELENRVATNPDDHEARLSLAHALAAASRYDEALRHYLEIVKRDRSFQDDAARKAMLDVFEILGGEHELTERYRSELAKVLFS